MAIIAILAAMLLPALRNAKETAKKVVCVSNLRQIGVGIFCLADDNDGDLPLRNFWLWGVDTDYATYNSGLFVISSLVNGRYLSAQIFYCPSAINGPVAVTGTWPAPYEVAPYAPARWPLEPSYFAHVWGPGGSIGSVPYGPDGTGSPNGPNIVGWVKNLCDLKGSNPEGGSVDPTRLSLVCEYTAGPFYPTYNHHGGFGQPTVLNILWADGSVSPCTWILYQSPWGYVPHYAYKR